MASVLVHTEEKKASVLVYTGEKASALVRTGRENARVVKRDNIVYVAHGPTGPEGPAGVGGASRTTLLNITQQSPSGTAFFVNSGSTHYTFAGDIGNLGPSAQGYLDNEAIQLYLRGGKLLKKEHTEWTSEFSFILYMPVDIGDYIEILS